MVKKADDIEFLTTGRQPSDSDFKRISEWIRDQKGKKNKNHKTSFIPSTVPPKV